MIWILYNVLFGFVFLLLTPRFLLRMKRRGGYADGFLQRLGVYGDGVLRFDESSERIWIHAVSVGEMFVALKLMDEIRSRRPNVCFIVSMATSTAHRVATERVADQDSVLYFPVDFPWVMRKVLHVLKPSRLILIEGEMWPNLIRLASRRNIQISIVNGRLSESSFQGYRKLRWVTRRILPLMDTIVMQGEKERERMILLGANPDRTFALGSAKFDVADSSAVDSHTARAVLAHVGVTDDHWVLLGGSTWPGEEKALVVLYQSIKESVPNARLILVPRHAERAEQIIQEMETLNCAWIRRSAMPEKIPQDSVLLVDTTGELLSFYQEADVVFVGKSLREEGGQNPIEPAALGKAIVVGPNMQNFPGVMENLLNDEALIQVSDEAELTSTVLDLLTHPEKRTALGHRAAASVIKHRGVLTATLDRMGITT